MSEPVPVTRPQSLVNGGRLPDDVALNAAVSRLLCSESGERVVERLQAYIDSIRPFAGRWTPSVEGTT